MIAIGIFVVAVIVTALALVHYIPILFAIPAIGVVVAVGIGWVMRQNSGPAPPA